MHYLDNAATTRVADTVADTADAVLRAHYANPSSLYAPGAQSDSFCPARGKRWPRPWARSRGDRVHGLRLRGQQPCCSGRGEGARRLADHIVVTGYEHPSVQNPVAALEKEGWRVTVVRPDASGHVDAGALVRAVGSKTALVTAMHVNNEVGSILDVAALAKAVKEKNSRTAVHIDGVQAWGKVPQRLNGTAIDSYAVSGHKIHAPKGVGALYVRRGYNLAPVFLGGGQEQKRRPGTENVAYIAAMARAIERMLADGGRAGRIAALNKTLRDALAGMPGIVLNSPADALPELVNFSVEGVKSETMLHFLESRDVYVSSGSACSRGEASHTLTAMGLPKSRVDTALRVSFSGESTPEDVRALLDALAEGMRTLAKIRR
ncbi:MAG: cysteine desulfurase family protein [Ruthenibacterium lactatiformans]